MVHIIMGPEGSGKTKMLIDAIHQALKEESGSMVCIEKGSTLRFDVDHRVRLIDAGEYALGSYTFLKGFISGLYAGNYDITDIFVDATFKICGKDPEKFADMVERLYKLTSANGLTVVFTVSCEPEEVPERIRKYQI